MPKGMNGYGSVLRRLLDEVLHMRAENLHAPLPLALAARAVIWVGREGSVVSQELAGRYHIEHGDEVA